MATRHSFLSTTGLIRAPSNTGRAASSRHAKSGGTKPEQPACTRQPSIVTKAGILPLGPTFLIGIAIGFSLIFIISISCAFIGSDDDEPPFKNFLNNIAETSPGIVLLGDNVDVDVDEPSVTVRWSIIGCGLDFVLPGSEGTHGSALCGIPSMPLNIFVDSASDPSVTYDPTLFPIANKTGQRLSIQNLCQFDSDHVLDVHEARLYPFDTYHLSSTLRISSPNGDEPIPMTALTTMKITSSFAISPTDVESYMNTSDKSYGPSRDITLVITRPPEARLFALLLFGTSWMLAHATMGLVVLAWVQKGEERVLRYLVLDFVILLAIPQLRNAMPDAPGFDGVLIDSIGFFPQMLCSGASAIAMLAMIALRGLQPRGNSGPTSSQESVPESQPVPKGLERLRRQGSSVDFRHIRGWSRAAFTSERR